MQCVTLNLGTGVMCIVNAGHPCAVLYSARYGRCDILPVPGEVLHDSLVETRQLHEYEQYLAEFDPGDILVMLTDGLLEAHRLSGDPYGYRFTRIIEENRHSSARAIGEAIVQDFRQHSSRGEYRDDVLVAVVCVREHEA
jgi:hypothetical protein